MRGDDLLAELCRSLHLLREQAGGPSVRELATQLQRGKSQVSAILNGQIRRPPDWHVVRGLIEACYKHAHDHGRAHRLTLHAGIEEYWRPRYAMLEHAFSQSSQQARSPAVPAPRQLPPAVPHFVGRVDALAALRRAGTGGGPLLVVGMAGVGKTTLAVHWARHAAGGFPDGQLYVNLRGFDSGGSPTDPADAVRGFLNSLGVPNRRIPMSLDAQAALYRSLLADRRMLILLDNASDADQVRPLLPGAPGCQVVVTSRDQLAGLVAADGAYLLPLDVLTPDEARELLARRLGPDRVAAEPDAAEEIVERCARLPLALTVVATRAAAHPRFPLRALAGELRDVLVTLSGGDAATDVRAVFSWSYRALSRDAARLFRLLGLHPGPDISAPAAASLAGLGLSRARELLGELARAHLAIEHVPGRYTLHDLVRAYAAKRVEAGEPGAATIRLLDHYVHSAYAAALLLNPARDRIVLDPARPGTTPEHPADQKQALEWLTVEHRVLVGVVEHAATTGYDRHAWQLTWSLFDFFELRAHWLDWAAIALTALTATQRLGDAFMQAKAHNMVARAFIALGRAAEARPHLSQALDLALRAGDGKGQAHAHHNLAIAWESEGQYTEALHHAQQALDWHRSASDLTGQSRALSTIGWIHSQLGHYREAIAACERGLALCQELNDRQGEAGSWDNLGYAHHHLGEYRQAVDCYRRAIEICRDLGDRYHEAVALIHTGDTHHAVGHRDAAQESWRQALSILDDLDHPEAAEVRIRLDSS